LAKKVKEGQPTRLSASSFAAGAADLTGAEAVLQGLAQVFFLDGAGISRSGATQGKALPNLEAKYRTLIEQIPAVVFMVYLDGGIGEAYVSPQIEEMLGFSQEEWLEDPIRWYSRIHPDDKSRWSEEAAEMFLTGKPFARCIESSPGMGIPCPFTVKRRWFGSTMVVLGSSME
jgi:PAS domain-containing protein